MILFGNSNISPHILATIPLLYGFPAALPKRPGARIAPQPPHPAEADRLGVLLPPTSPPNSPAVPHHFRPDCLPPALPQANALPSAHHLTAFRRNRLPHHCDAALYCSAAAPSVAFTLRIGRGSPTVCTGYLIFYSCQDRGHRTACPAHTHTTPIPLLMPCYYAAIPP